MTHNKIKTSEKERLGKKKESYVVMHVFSNNKHDFFFSKCVSLSHA